MYIKTQESFGESLINMDHAYKITVRKDERRQKINGKKELISEVVVRIYRGGYETGYGFEEQLGVYTSAVRAEEVMREIRMAIEAGAHIYPMPEN